MADQQELLFERMPSGVGIVTLNRPDRLNALSGGIARGLISPSEELRQDHDTKVIILRGDGRAFCSGGDVAAFYGSEGERPPWHLPHREVQATNILRELDQPVIGAIHGYAVGAGFALALATDLRIAAEGTKFGVY